MNNYKVLSMPNPMMLLVLDIFSKGGIEKYTSHIGDILITNYGSDNVIIGSFAFCNFENTTIKICPNYYGKGKGILRKIIFAFRTIDYIRKYKIKKIICGHISLAPIIILAKLIYNVKYICVTYGIEVWSRISTARQVCLKNADQIISISRFTAGKLEEVQNISKNKIRILHNAVDIIKYTPTDVPNHLRRKLHISNKKIILSVSRLSSKERYKGHDRMIRLMPKVLKAVPNALFIIVGEGDDKERLMEMVKTNGMQDHIIFTGYVRDEMLLEYYNLCDVFIMASETKICEGMISGEGFGYVYLEASACGKPVIAGKYGGSAEAVMDGKTGLLVDPENDEEILNAVIKILQDDSLAKSMGQAGRAFVEKNFSSHLFNKKFIDILKDAFK